MVITPDSQRPDAASTGAYPTLGTAPGWPLRRRAGYLHSSGRWEAPPASGPGLAVRWAALTGGSCCRAPPSRVRRPRPASVAALLLSAASTVPSMAWPRGDSDERPEVPSLRQRPDADVRRPRHVTAVRELPRGRPARPGRGFLPPARADLLVVPAGPAAGVPHGRGHLQPLRVLLLLLRLLGGAREAVRAVRRRPARPRQGLLRGRGRQQRRLPPAARARPAASGASASSRRRTSRRWPGPRASTRSASSSARRRAPRWPPTTARPTW